MKKSLRWGIAYQFIENWRDAPLWRSIRIPNPPNRFLADPFVVKNSNSHFCFVEDYCKKKAKGRISVYRIKEEGHEELGVALEESFHLSYPFIFEFNGILYMCPETHEAGDIRLYQCVDFPLKWEFKKTLIPNVSAADTNIFKRGKYWWLMTNISTGEPTDHCSQLHIFYSDNPLSDKWHSHPNNPVIFDPLTARNGGLIYGKNNLYRIYQIQGFDFYGKSVGISKITKITKNEYHEIKAFEVTPDFFENAEGIHTFNFCEGLLAIDFVEMSRY